MNSLMGIFQWTVLWQGLRIIFYSKLKISEGVVYIVRNDYSLEGD